MLTSSCVTMGDKPTEGGGDKKASFFEKDYRDSGLRQARTSVGFRLVNPELFIKPVGDRVYGHRCLFFFLHI